jgi:hypothetical protein
VCLRVSATIPSISFCLSDLKHSSDEEFDLDVDVTTDPLGKKLFQYLVLMRTEVGDLDGEVTLSTDTMNLPSQEVIESLVTGE